MKATILFAASLTALASVADVSGATLLVANGLGDRSVHAYDATTLAPVAGFNFVPDPGFVELLSIAVSGDSFYVGKAHTGVGRYDVTTGAPATGWTSPGVMHFPYGLAVSGNRLYISNYDTNTVGVYNATTGAVLTTSLISGLSGPVGLAILGNLLYVTNNDTSKVGLYDAITGATINANFITGLNEPFGLAVSDLSLYVAESGNNYASNGTVRKYDATTGLPSAGWNSPSGLNLPEGLAVADNRVYVANWLGFTVDAFDATSGAAIAGWNLPTDGNPAGVAVYTRPIPEPATAALLALGAPILAVRRRRG